jgi:hypothetical protein
LGFFGAQKKGDFFGVDPKKSQNGSPAVLPTPKKVKMAVRMALPIWTPTFPQRGTAPVQAAKKIAFRPQTDREQAAHFG